MMSSRIIAALLLCLASTASAADITQVILGFISEHFPSARPRTQGAACVVRSLCWQHLRARCHSSSARTIQATMHLPMRCRPRRLPSAFYPAPCLAPPCSVAPHLTSRLNACSGAQGARVQHISLGPCRQAGSGWGLPQDDGNDCWGFSVELLDAVLRVAYPDVPRRFVKVKSNGVGVDSLLTPECSVEGSTLCIAAGDASLTPDREVGSQPAHCTRSLARVPLHLSVADTSTHVNIR